MRTGFLRAFGVSASLALFSVFTAPAFAQDAYGLYDGGSYYGSSALQSNETFEGWWLGGTLGGTTVNYDSSVGSFNTDGLIGGVVGGFSWQHGPFVISLEGDYLASDVSGSGKINGGANKVKVGFDNVWDARMRLGYAIQPNLLLFGTLGGSWANADVYLSGAGGGFKETTFAGWSAGGGAEYAYDKNWSLRFDYQFTDFGEKTINYRGSKETFDPDANSFRGSVIYRF